jgi:hypothetical protein
MKFFWKSIEIVVYRPLCAMKNAGAKCNTFFERKII